ncbi:MAG: type II toxin-antitoxin system VapC family toxin [Candidatus Bathyarchaeia archaeon]
MTVIDSSSLAKYVNREPGWKKVEDHLRMGVATIPLALKETGNTLWKRVRAGQLTKEFSHQVFEELLELRPFKVLDQETVLSSALEISTEEDIPIYDAIFIALSEKMREAFITSDSKQAEAAKRRKLQVIYIP